MRNADTIRELVSKERLEEAIKILLKNNLEKEKSNEVLSLLGRLKRLKTSNVEGVLSVDEATLEQNRIRKAILTLVQELEDARKNLPKKKQAKSNRKGIIIVLLIIGFIVASPCYFRYEIKKESLKQLAIYDRDLPFIYGILPIMCIFEKAKKTTINSLFKKKKKADFLELNRLIENTYSIIADLETYNQDSEIFIEQAKRYYAYWEEAKLHEEEWDDPNSAFNKKYDERFFKEVEDGLSNYFDNTVQPLIDDFPKIRKGLEKKYGKEKEWRQWLADFSSTRINDVVKKAFLEAFLEKGRDTNQHLKIHYESGCFPKFMEID